MTNSSTAQTPLSKAPRAWHQRDGIWLALILLIGVALRIWYLSQILHAPDFMALRQDLDVQDYQARAMISGDWTVREGENDPKIPTTPYYRPPGYPYFLAAIYYFSNGSYLAPRLVNMALGLLSVVLMYLLGRALHGRGVGLVTAFFMSTYWAFLFYEGEVNDPVVFVFLTPCLLLILLAWQRKMTFPRAFLAGAIVGAYALMRPNILLFGPFIAAWMLWLAWRRKTLFRFVPSWIGLALAPFLIIAPVTLRNYIVSGEFVPISTYYGENLLIGNSEDADGVTPWTPYLQHLEGTGNFSVWVYENIVEGLGKEQGIENLSHSEASNIFARKAFEYIKAHPWRTFTLTLRKAVLFWSPIEITENKVVQYEKEFYAPLKYLPGFALVMALWVGGSLLLFSDFWKRRVWIGRAGAAPVVEMTLLIYAFVLVYFASFLPFFVNARARVPLLGLMLLPGAYGLCRIGKCAAEKRWKGVAAGFIAFAVLYGLASIEYIPFKPDRARWHYARADSYLRQGEVDKALQEAEEMMALPEPPMPYMPFRLGHAFARIKKHEAAVRFLQAALDIKPEAQHPRYREDLLYHIARELHAMGKEEESRAKYDEALKVNPEDARIYNDLGVIADQAGRTEEARAYFEDAIRVAPDFALALSNLGDLEGRLGDHAKAVLYFERAIEAQPAQQDFYYNLGLHLAAAGRTEEAIERYRTAIVMNPDDPRPLNNLGLLFAQQGDAAAAQQSYEEAIRVAPKFTLAYANLGDLFFNQGKLDEAKAMYERGLETDAENAGLHNALGYLLAQQGDREGAETQYREALRIAPDYTFAHNNLGNLLAQQGRMEEAIEHYQRALASTPAFWNAAFNLGVVLEYLGRNEEAAAQFRDVLKWNPENAAARQHLEKLTAPETPQS